MMSCVHRDLLLEMVVVNLLRILENIIYANVSIFSPMNDAYIASCSSNMINITTLPYDTTKPHWKSGPSIYGVDKYMTATDRIKLLGRLTQTFDPYMRVAQYTEQAMVDGHLKTIHEMVLSSQITSFESWNMWDT